MHYAGAHRYFHCYENTGFDTDAVGWRFSAPHGEGCLHKAITRAFMEDDTVSCSLLLACRDIQGAAPMSPIPPPSQRAFYMKKPSALGMLDDYRRWLLVYAPE